MQERATDTPSGSRATHDRVHGASRRSSASATLGRLALVLGLLIQPLAPALHIAFADHQHRHCPEHGRYEDVVGVSETAPAAVERPTTPGLVPATAPTEHTPCRALNGVAAPTPRLQQRLETAVAIHDGVVPERPPLTLPARRATLLLLAPKNSPPTTALAA